MLSMHNSLCPAKRISPPISEELLRNDAVARLPRTDDTGDDSRATTAAAHQYAAMVMAVLVVTPGQRPRHRTGAEPAVPLRICVAISVSFAESHRAKCIQSLRKRWCFVMVASPPGHFFEFLSSSKAQLINVQTIRQFDSLMGHDEVMALHMLPSVSRISFT